MENSTMHTYTYICLHSTWNKLIHNINNKFYLCCVVYIYIYVYTFKYP